MTEEKDFLDGYTDQSTEELIALAETHRIDSIIIAFEQALLNVDSLRSLTKEERITIVVEAFEREFNNGGLLQFFDFIKCNRTKIITNR
jgi:hypothetical protein